MKVPSLQDRVSAEEWQLRVDLAACYRLVALHGWICNPQGDEADFEGSRCYDVKFNDRDAASQVTIMDE